MYDQRTLRQRLQMWALYRAPGGGWRLNAGDEVVEVPTYALAVEERERRALRSADDLPR